MKFVTISVELEQKKEARCFSSNSHQYVNFMEQKSIMGFQDPQWDKLLNFYGSGDQIRTYRGLMSRQNLWMMLHKQFLCIIILCFVAKYLLSLCFLEQVYSLNQ